MTIPDDLGALDLWPEVGERLGLGKSATYRAAANGQIPTIRIGRRIVVPIPALRMLLERPGRDAAE
jgi:excisionase family DNA binding protein